MKATTPSFVTEIEILPTPRQAKKIRAKFEVARLAYNACLHEFLKRYDRMTQSRAWKKARKIKNKKERNEAFGQIKRHFCFSDRAISNWLSRKLIHSWMRKENHFKSKTMEAIAQVAFKSVEEYLYHPNKRKRPRFRRKGDWRSIPGRTHSCCRWKGDHINWCGMKVPAKIDLSDPVVTHGLSCPVKYVRMVRRVIRERERFYAQLVCQGEPYCKDRLVRCGPVGLDIGTQTIAAVSRKQAFIEVFCRELYRDHKKIRRIQRRMDRLRRENNPDNFRSDGTFKKQGNRKVQWKDSREYRRERKRLRELHRKESAHRRNVHGQLVARVLRLGSDVKLEKISYQSWPKKKKRKGNQPRRRYGRSVNFCAPSLFVSRLKQEIAKWGGQVTEFNTQTTKLSQVCHCGYSAKKSLNQRWHQCPQCGIVVQRDLYSAFLASYVENGTLRADQAGNAWSSICTALGTALNQVKDAPGRLPSSLGLRKLKKSALSLKDRKNLPDSADVVRAVSATEGREKGEENDHNTQFFVDALNGTPNLVIDYG